MAASVTLSVVLTIWGIFATKLIHASAYATTLIVSLGLLSPVPQVAIIVMSVIILVEFHIGGLVSFKRLVGTDHPGYVEGHD